MNTASKFKDHQVLSCEVFPPKRTSPIDSIYKTIEGLAKLQPDFISVTFGAGGSSNSAATLDIASAIKHRYGIESVAHLPAICLTKQEAAEILRQFKAAGIDNILALRGDVPTGNYARGDFTYASDLISFIREQGDFNIIAACYPEGHPESANLIEDMRNLKKKVDAGASQLISQLFFNNDFFYRFRDRCALSGIEVPIEAGIMPVVNKKQIERMVSLCGAELPHKFTAMMARYEHNPVALRDAGIAYAIDQIVDLIAQGVDGIHLYTMNNPEIASRIYEAIHHLIKN